MRRLMLICLGVLLGCQPAKAMTYKVYARVLDVVEARDLKALKQLRANGLDMNSPTPSGMTPLCETVMKKDYEGYEMLLTQGASPYVSCMRQLPEYQVANFYANQPPPHTYYVGYLEKARAASAWGTPVAKEFSFPTLGVGEVLLGGVAAAGILTLGHGGSSSGSEGNKYVWTAPLDLQPTDFETRQYKADNVFSGDPEVNSVNFLGSVKASSAYARGYTGYEVKRKPDGSLDGEGSAAIDTDKKVAVAIVDDGVWVEHPQLTTNISVSSNKTYNFMYGACNDNASTGKCWELIDDDETSGKVTLQLYNNGEPVADRFEEMDKISWLVYKTETAGYNPNDPTPTIHMTWQKTDPSDTTLYPRYKIGSSWYLYDTDAGEEYEITCDEESGNCWYESGEQTISVTAVPAYYNADGIPVSGYDNHGTHVAGLVAAKSDGEGGNSGMMGVAYNADIIPIKFDETMNETINHIADAINLGADIVNFSSASPDKLKSETDDLVGLFDTRMAERPDFLKAYQTAAKNNTILVFAAGNYIGEDAPYDSSIFSMAPLSSLLNGTTEDADKNTYNLTNLFVNVVALNDTLDGLAAYSAKCGLTQDYCVAAPGGLSSNIYSTIYNGEYTYGGDIGTSMATSIVSGALAVIKGAFPHLTNQQVVQILFETAKDLGKKGVDETYGHGLIDLEAATSPVGLPKIPLSTSVSGVAVSTTESSSTVPSSLTNIASALPKKMVVLDKYNRAFAVATSEFVHVAKRENKLEGRFKSFMRGNEKVVVDNDKLTMAYSERRSDLNSKGIQQGSVRFEIHSSPKWSFKSYYTENTETSGGTYFERLMQSPYAKMKEAWGGAVSYNLGKNWIATVSGQIGQNGFVDKKDLNHMEHNKISLFQSTLQYNGLKRMNLKLTSGVTNEQGSTLGMWGRGAFKTGNSRTSFVGAGVTLNLMDALTLEGMYYMGKTQIDNGNSLMKMSNLRSDSFALTAAWKVNEGRTFGLQFVSPLRVRQGTATVDLPVARDAYQDVVYRQSVKAGLKPSAREYDIGLYYADDVREDVHLQSEVGVRLNPDHVAGATPDWRALLGLRLGL